MARDPRIESSVQSLIMAHIKLMWVATYRLANGVRDGYLINKV